MPFPPAGHNENACKECGGRGFIYSRFRYRAVDCPWCMGTGEQLTAADIGRRLADIHLKIVKKAVQEHSEEHAQTLRGAEWFIGGDDE